MTDVYNEYRRKSGAREDPRLARRNSKSSSSSEQPKQLYDKLGVPISPKQASSSPSPSSDPRVRDHGWQAHQPQTPNNQYNTSMQTAYQHLPPSMYADHTQYSAQGYSTNYTAYQQNYVAQSAGYNPYQGYSQTAAAYNSGLLQKQVGDPSANTPRPLDSDSLSYRFLQNPTAMENIYHSSTKKTVQPGPPGEEYPRNEWAPVSGYPNMTHPPPSHAPPPVSQPVQIEKNDDHKKDAIAQELKQQKAQMAKQREEYVRKVGVLHRELELLRNQKQELLAEHSTEHENNHILRENNKLQIEIQNKMKTIYNVIEMLTNIIGDRLTISELDEMYREDSPKQRREKTRRSMSSEKNDLDAKFCYKYYDPELHWCRICDVFPKSAKDYLLHLHSKEHRQVTQERDMVDTPWHRLPPEPELPSFEAAAKKRLPIKGLQFLISATAWYCKLCDTWVGDLHCASQHLKSQNHNQNYANFVEQNPHWEIEWLRDRDKALVRTSKGKRSDSDDSDNLDESDRKSKKRKDRHSPSDKKDKKKKKQKKRRRQSSDSSSSSSSSDSSSEDDNNDKSKSIRVAMRNKMKLQAQMIMNEDLGGKWEVLGRLVEEHKRKEAADMGKESGSEDNLINQWMTVNEPQEKDKRLFDTLKDRMKQKQDAEKARLAELEQKRREKEKQEQELREKKEKEEQEAREREEEKRRQQEELERPKDKEREQIRFKTKDKYRRRSSASASPERNRGRYSRSPSPEHRRRERTPDRYRGRESHHENGRRASDNRRRSPSYESRESPSSKRKSYKHDDKDSESRDSDLVKRDKKSQIMSHKKPHFIGRMPLFKNKKNEDKVEKEIKKEDYDIPRQSRFQPGNLARAFIPEPEVVCFPKLSSIPPIMIPPPPSVQPPDPPRISEEKLKAPPPPVINSRDRKAITQPSPEIQDMDIEEQNIPPPPPPPMSVKDTSNKEPPRNKILPRDFQDALNLIYPDPSQVGVDPTMMQYQYNMDYNNMMYPPMYDYSQDVPVESTLPPPLEQVPVEHTLPLQPPPLPPDDPNEDLAMLGISADDMAAQMF